MKILPSHSYARAALGTIKYVDHSPSRDVSNLTVDTVAPLLAVSERALPAILWSLDNERAVAPNTGKALDHVTEALSAPKRVERILAAGEDPALAAAFLRSAVPLMRKSWKIRFLRPQGE